MPPHRVQKLLAQAGIASRRKCEELIKAGRVTVNGKIIQVGATATEQDTIKVDGKNIKAEKLVYVILNKPKGVITTREDPHAITTVVDMVRVPERVFPVGRLDKNTEGLVLLTNDGNVANLIMHPRYGVEKTYVTGLSRSILPEDMQKIRDGVIIEQETLKVLKAKLLAPDVVQLSVQEGRKHILRKLFLALGYGVLQLVRTSIGPLQLGRLAPGKWRKLTAGEVSVLKRSLHQKIKK